MKSRTTLSGILMTLLVVGFAKNAQAQATFQGIGTMPSTTCTSYAPDPAGYSVSFPTSGAVTVTGVDATGTSTTNIYNFTVPESMENPSNLAGFIGLDVPRIFTGCSGAFPSGSATRSYPGINFPWDLTTTATTANGVVSFRTVSVENDCPSWLPGGTCIRLDYTTILTSSYTIATGAYTVSWSESYTALSTDATGTIHYTSQESASGSASGVVAPLVTSLPGTTFSEVRDATKVNGAIIAVGGAARNPGATGEDTAVMWTAAGGLVALPDIVQNNVATNIQSASQITRDGSTIASRARTSVRNDREAVLVTNGGTTNTPLGYLSGVTAIAQYSAATSLSEDASVVYGFGRYDDTGEAQAFRWTAGTGMQPLGFAVPGDISSVPAGRAISTDGSVILGTSLNTAFVTTYGVGNRAFRYVSGSGMTLLPLLPGGTGSAALALTPDGGSGLGIGDSSAYPNGELILWNFASGTAQGLGSPDGTLSPGNFGGLTADGLVAGTWFNDASNNSSSFIHNAQGWFPLAAVLGSAGIDLTGWTPDVLIGISPDGTLLFGSGLHNGNREGWVASVPGNYLRDYGADTTPPVITPVVTGTLGSNGWYRSNVSISWTVTDPESAVSAQQGCGVSTVTSDTSGITFTCTATSAGGTSSRSVTLKRDATVPGAVLLSPLQNFTVCFGLFSNHCYQSPATYAKGSKLTARYYCTDFGPSGLAQCTGTLPNGALVNTSTAGTYSFTVSAVDKAGNVKTVQSIFQVK
jgi:hypothetical protein